MFGKGVYQEEELLLREIVRSIDKKADYTVREGEGSRFYSAAQRTRTAGQRVAEY